MTEGLILRCSWGIEVKKNGLLEALVVKQSGINVTIRGLVAAVKIQAVST